MEKKKKAKNDIWVYIELCKEGKAKRIGLELINPARQLADKMDGICTAVVLGENTECAIDEAKMYGADRVISVQDERLNIYNTEIYTDAMYKLVSEYDPKAVLLGATQDGRDLAPRLACRLKTGLTADCTGISFDEKLDRIIWTRPAFGGNLMAEIYCPKTDPQMGTVRQGVFKPVKVEKQAGFAVVNETMPDNVGGANIELLEFIKESLDDSSDLEGSDIIVAGGRGTAGERGFKLIYELAEILGAEVGASRGAVEAGYISRTKQVGQTGKTVSPKLYIACGISGAIQHLTGMSGAKTVIAINKDPEAPIHKEADYSVAGDMFEIIPELIACLKNQD